MITLNFNLQPKIFPQSPRDIRLRKTVQKFSGDWPKEISGVIVMEIGGERQGFEVKVPVSDQAPVGEAIPCRRKVAQASRLPR